MFDFPNAPVVGQQVIEPNGAVVQWDGVKWTNVANPNVASPSLNNIGRNLVHNSRFEIQQRGTGPWTTNGAFTADRWALLLVGSTATVNIGIPADAGRIAIGDESFTSFLGTAVTGTSGASDYVRVSHVIENARRLTGKVVTLSFWAYASAALQIGIRIDTNFGSGGSPSASISSSPQTINANATWAKYTLTFILPSANGMTFGTNNDSYIRLNFFYTAGSALLASVGVGVQSGSFNIWGVQLEIGPTATPLEKLEYNDELRHCERFYQNYDGVIVSGYNGAGLTIFLNMPLRVIMRATPTFTIRGTVSYSNCSGLSQNSILLNNIELIAIITSTGAGWAVGAISLSADL